MIAGTVVWAKVSTPRTSQIKFIYLNIVNLTYISSSFNNCKNLGRICSDVFFLPTKEQKLNNDLAKESISKIKLLLT